MLIEDTAIKSTDHAVDALKKKQFFKLVCGASLTDLHMIENLCFVFTLAGAHMIDLAPKADVIFAARRGVEKGISYSMLNPQSSILNPVLMASIQLDKDPHFRKVEVDNSLCDVCGACVKVCPTEAFKIPSSKSFIYSVERCFGCGICPSVCHVSALNMIDVKPTPRETLKEMLLLGVKVIEFHFGENVAKLELIWDEVKDLVNDLELISFSIGSELLTDENIKFAANLCYKLAGEGIILQCDGVPMSGGIEDKYKVKKNGNNGIKIKEKCIHVAKIIQEEKLPVYLQISGGTDYDSYSRSLEYGVSINGVAIGSFARKLLMPYLNQLNDENKLIEAVQVARSLVDSATRRNPGEIKTYG